MQITPCHLVYDITTAGYVDWWFPLGGLGMTAIFGVMLWTHIQPGGRFKSKRWLLYVAVPFLILWTITAFIMTYGSYAVTRHAISTGRYTHVEGVVQHFQPGDAGDHEDEQWDVHSNGSTYYYRYNPSALTPGFRQTQPHGGPIRNGLRVRIADVDGYIARLEICP